MLSSREFWECLCLGSRGLEPVCDAAQRLSNTVMIQKQITDFEVNRKNAAEKSQGLLVEHRARVMFAYQGSKNHSR